MSHATDIVSGRPDSPSTTKIAAIDESIPHIEPERPHDVPRTAWMILALAGLANFFSGPGQSYTFAAFIDPMLATFDAEGLTRSGYSLIYTVATLVSAGLLPGLGRGLDRFGAKIVLPVCVVALTIACLGLGAAGSVLAFTIAVVAVRSLGQGALTMIPTWMVGQWFDRRRGLAMSLLGIAGSLSFVVFPVASKALIDAFGWRMAWTIIGLSVSALLLVPSLLMVRDRDRDVSKGSGPRGLSTVNEPELTIWTLGSAVRTGVFWKISLAMVTSGLICTALVFHQVSLFKQRGLSADLATWMVSLQAVFATITCLVGGFLVDRYGSRTVLAWGMVLLTLSMVLYFRLDSWAMALVYSALIGIHAGFQRVSGSVMVLDYFGRHSYGSIKGVIMTAMVFGAALGPLPLALSLDYLGSYDPVVLALIVLPVASTWAAWSARRPKLSADS